MAGTSCGLGSKPWPGVKGKRIRSLCVLNHHVASVFPKSIAMFSLSIKVRVYFIPKCSCPVISPHEEFVFSWP